MVVNKEKTRNRSLAPYTLRHLVVLLAGALLVFIAVTLMADEVREEPDFVEFKTTELDPATLRAIEKGLEYLAGTQQKDGS